MGEEGGGREGEEGGGREGERNGSGREREEWEERGVVVGGEG